MKKQTLAVLLAALLFTSCSGTKVKDVDIDALAESIVATVSFDDELEMIGRDGAKRDPSPAKTEKSPLSEPNSRQESRSNGSATGLNSRPSVREKLDDYKVKAAAEREKRNLERATERMSEAAVHLPKTKQKER